MEHENKQFKRSFELTNKLKRGVDPYPQIIEIHPTYRCNHRCAYCFHRGVKYNSSKNPGFLKIPHYKSLFKEMNSLGINDLSISGGGEPTMDTRLPALIREAYRNSLHVRMVSNGSFMSNKLLNELKKLVKFVLVSMQYMLKHMQRFITYPKLYLKKPWKNIRKVISLKERGVSQN